MSGSRESHVHDASGTSPAHGASGTVTTDPVTTDPVTTDSVPASKPSSGRPSWLGRARAWWRGGFPGKVRLFAVAAWLAAGPLIGVESAFDMFMPLALLAVIMLLPRAPRVAIAIGLPLCLAAGFMAGNLTEACSVIALFAIFLTAGYALARWPLVAAVMGYAVAEVTCAVVWHADSAAVNVLTGFVSGFLDGYAGVPQGTPGEVGGSVPPELAWAFGVLLSVMMSGFLAAFGRSFRANVEAGKAIARNEAMLGRVTREQRLAHMIHDSVANDMSVIAMLSWRVKQTLPAKNAPGEGEGTATTGQDVSAMLDAIYARSHHALDRVHEVIDVLDGKRDLSDVMPSDAHDDGVGTDSTVPLGARLEKFAEDQDRTMAMLGMAGVSRIKIDDAARPGPAVTDAVLSLVEEIYANIVRHAAWDGDAAHGAAGATGVGPAYSLFVTGTRDTIRVTEVNRIAGGESQAIRGTRHGKGLALQRAAVETLGGTLNASAQDGTWTIAAELPVR